MDLPDTFIALVRGVLQVSSFFRNAVYYTQEVIERWTAIQF